MKRWEFTPQAKTDLLELAHYIANDSLDAADRFLELIDDKCKMLAEHPQLGPERESLVPSLRSFAVGDYLIFYRPTDSGIEVIRVLSGYRDLDTLLGS